MRTRARTTYGSLVPLVPLTYERYDSGVRTQGPTQYSGGAQSVYSYAKTETITDDISDLRGVKVVQHVVLESIPVIDGFTSYGSFSINPRYTGSGASLNQWVLPNGSGHIFPSLSGSYWLVEPNTSQDALVRDTVDAFYNVNQVDNLLNIIEAPQLLGSLLNLATSLARAREYILKYGLLKGYQGLRNNWSAWTIKKKLGYFGRRGRNVSDLYLTYSFGIAPLLSDMRKIQREIRAIKAKIKAELAKQSGRLVSVHRSCGYTFSYRNTTTGVKVGYHDSSTYSLRYTGTLDAQVSRRVCTVRGYQTPRYDSAALRQLDYMMARFGVTGPASLAWELIPFSFVVDWFLDLRHITNSLDNLLTGSPKKIVDVCLSDKIKWTDTAVLNSGYNPSTQGTVMGRIVNTSYTRNPVLSYNKVGLSGRFGKKQASLTAALLYQQVANMR